MGIFEHLLKEGLIEDKPECVDVIIQKLSDINTALRESGIANVTENIAVLGAMTFYKLQDQAKYRSFIHWVQKNNIGIADKLHINDVISIYDSVYAHTPKRVFLARWYPDSEPHLSKANGRLAVIKRIVEQDFGLQLIDLGTKGGGTYSIRDLMYREIEASDIFIADLTSNRHNVIGAVHITDNFCNLFSVSTGHIKFRKADDLKAIFPSGGIQNLSGFSVTVGCISIGG